MVEADWRSPFVTTTSAPAKNQSDATHDDVPQQLINPLWGNLLQSGLCRRWFGPVLIASTFTAMSQMNRLTFM